MLKNSEVVLFLSPRKLVRPETTGPYHVYGARGEDDNCLQDFGCNTSWEEAKTVG
jgi:hypothetical protein